MRSALFVHGLRVDARVGVHAHERDGQQPLIVDIDVEIPLPERDNISAALDYVDVADLVRRVAVSRHFDLVESFAQSVGRELLAIAAVERVSVCVTKPSALAGLADTTGFELTLQRA